MDGSLLSVTGARKTLKAAIGCVGTGLHSGDRVSLTLRPAEAGTGILFRRTDLGVDIPARYDLVTDTRLCTALTCLTPAGEARIGTVEHVLAALAGCGVDDCVIELIGADPVEKRDLDLRPELHRAGQLVVEAAGRVGDGGGDLGAVVVDQGSVALLHANGDGIHDVFPRSTVSWQVFGLASAP